MSRLPTTPLATLLPNRPRFRRSTLPRSRRLERPVRIPVENSPYQHPQSEPSKYPARPGLSSSSSSTTLCLGPEEAGHGNVFVDCLPIDSDAASAQLPL